MVILTPVMNLLVFGKSFNLIVWNPDFGVRKVCYCHSIKHLDKKKFTFMRIVKGPLQDCQSDIQSKLYTASTHTGSGISWRSGDGVV